MKNISGERENLINQIVFSLLNSDKEIENIEEFKENVSNSLEKMNNALDKMIDNPIQILSKKLANKSQ